MRSLEKNLNQTIKEHSQNLIFFFDEAGFGMHSKLGHDWFEKGKKTAVKVKLGFTSMFIAL
jgi:hypothetical protein